jgi:hypothetical protein
MSEPLLTLFSTPKPFTDPHIAMIQRNAILSWKQLGGKVEVVLIGDEIGVKELAQELKVRFIPDVRRNEQGTPLVSSIFEQARNVNASPLLGFINSDIIVFPEIIDTCRQALEQLDLFVLAGQRWDLKVEYPIFFIQGWERKLKEDIALRGGRHEAAGSDYFIFPRACYMKIPKFAIGRAGWDNWMIFKARWEHWKMINASEEITVVHQDHDYKHLAGGKIHRKQPETLENIKLMGGRFAIFTLYDADCNWMDHQIIHRPFQKSRLLREVTIFPSVHMKSAFLGRIFYFLFNFQKVLRDVKNDKRLKAENHEKRSKSS